MQQTQPLKIFSHGTISQIIMKTIPISMRMVTSYAMKQGIPFWVWEKVNETETTIWPEFPNRGKANGEQILSSEKRKKSKQLELWESQSGSEKECKPSEYIYLR